MKLDIRPVVDRPDDLAGQQNGRLDPALLVQVHPDGRNASIDKLHHLTARKWLALVHYAAQAGIELSYTSCYRTYDEQVALWNARMVPELAHNVMPSGCISGSRRVWNGVGHWRRTGTAMCAVPGTSNHGWGSAIDMTTGWGGGKKFRGYVASITTSDVSKLTALAISCGFAWEVQSESWHIRDITGDTIPDAVAQFEAVTPSKPAPSQPANFPPPTGPPTEALPPPIIEETPDMNKIYYKVPTLGPGAFVGLTFNGFALTHVSNGHAWNAIKAPELEANREQMLGLIATCAVAVGSALQFGDAELDAAWAAKRQQTTSATAPVDYSRLADAVLDRLRDRLAA